MLHRIFSVYDSKVSAYMPLFTLRTRGEALRAFMDTTADANHLFHRHPEDYTLFAIGEFDDTDGSITTYETPEPIAKAIELITEKQRPPSQPEFSSMKDGNADYENPTQVGVKQNGQYIEQPTDSDEARLFPSADSRDTQELV